MPENSITRRALTRKEGQAIELVCAGTHTLAEASKECGLTEQKLRGLLRRPDVKQYIDDYTDDYLRTSAGKAAKLLRDQLDNENPWIAQNAARAILNFVRDQKDKEEFNINVVFNMPTPGMPQPTIEADGQVE